MSSDTTALDCADGRISSQRTWRTQAWKSFFVSPMASTKHGPVHVTKALVAVLRPRDLRIEFKGTLSMRRRWKGDPTAGFTSYVQQRWTDGLWSKPTSADTRLAGGLVRLSTLLHSRHTSSGNILRVSFRQGRVGGSGTNLLFAGP